MNRDDSNVILAIDINVRFRGTVYQLSLRRALKWLVPLVVLAVRLIWNRRDGP